MDSLTLPIIIMLVSIPLVAWFVYRVQKKRQSEKLPSHTESYAVKARPSFTGGRVYSLAIRGKYKTVFRLISLVAAGMPVVVLAILWSTNAHQGMAGSPATVRFWVFVVAMFAWSAMTLWFLRSLVRYRQGTIISLSSTGVHYYASPAGVFAAKDIFIPWDRIENVTSANPQHPSLIAVSSPYGKFTFDSQQAHEVQSIAVNGTFLTVDGEHSLYRDLLEFSGRGEYGTMPTPRTAAGV